MHEKVRQVLRCVHRPLPRAHQLRGRVLPARCQQLTWQRRCPTPAVAQDAHAHARLGRMHAIQAADAHGPTATSPPRRISIVYPTRDRPQFIAQSLTALLGNTVLPDEIVIVDQSRTDATRRAVGAFESPLIVHVPSTEVGLSRARNTGIRSSRFPIIGFIDDDCIPGRNSVASAKSVIERVPESAVWVGKVFYDERYITDEVIEAS